MKEHSLVPLVTQFAKPIAISLGLELWGVRITQGKSTVLQCFIDKDNDATIEDCTNFSRALSAELDSITAEDEVYAALASLPAYTLEVSTPGLERCFFYLTQLNGYIGKKFSVLLSRPLEALPQRRKLKGVLQKIEGNALHLSVLGEEYLCPWEQIERIHLVYFDKDN